MGVCGRVLGHVAVCRGMWQGVGACGRGGGMLQGVGLFGRCCGRVWGHVAGGGDMWQGVVAGYGGMW